MKKILYSILAVGISLVGCTDFEEAVSENYGAGPSISVEVTSTSDNGFIFTLTPASETVYYSYVVTKGSAASELNGLSLLKQQYSGVDGGLLNTNENTTATIDLSAEKVCNPNTSYIIYAVAANKEGVTGEVASAVITTTDTGIPYPKTVTAVEGETAIEVTFSESITQGEGTISAQYYAEWDGTFTDIAAEDIETSVEGNVVLFTFTNVPASATVLVSWEEGAFVDNASNACAALTSGLNSAGDGWKGVYFKAEALAFDITEENITSPEVGGSFQDAENTAFTMTFDMNVYRNTKTLTGGEIKVTYKHAGKSTTLEVPTNYWDTSENKLMFYLPEAPTYGDWVSIQIAEGTITDVYGNPNNEMSMENIWLYSYGYTRDMVIGTYDMNYYSYAAYSSTGNFVPITETITIEEDPEDENGILMSGFYGLNEKIKAQFNGDFATVSITEEQIVGKTTLSDGNEYYISIGGNTDDYSWVLDIDADGNLKYNAGSIATCYWYYDLSYQYIGMLEATINLQFVKQMAASSISPFKVAKKAVTNFNLIEHNNGTFVK